MIVRNQKGNNILGIIIQSLLSTLVGPSFSRRASMLSMQCECECECDLRPHCWNRVEGLFGAGYVWFESVDKRGCG